MNLRPTAVAVSVQPKCVPSGHVAASVGSAAVTTGAGAPSGSKLIRRLAFEARAERGLRLLSIAPAESGS